MPPFLCLAQRVCGWPSPALPCHASPHAAQREARHVESTAIPMEIVRIGNVIARAQNVTAPFSPGTSQTDCFPASRTCRWGLQPISTESASGSLKSSPKAGRSPNSASPYPYAARKPSNSSFSSSSGSGSRAHERRVSDRAETRADPEAPAPAAGNNLSPLGSRRSRKIHVPGHRTSRHLWTDGLLVIGRTESLTDVHRMVRPEAIYVQTFRRWCQRPPSTLCSVLSSR